MADQYQDKNPQYEPLTEASKRGYFIEKLAERSPELFRLPETPTEDFLKYAWRGRELVDMNTGKVIGVA